MASFFGVNIETPQEAQERIRQEMLDGLAFNQKQSTLQGVGYALAQAGGQAAEKWGGVVPESVRIARDTEATLSGGVESANQRISGGEDPLKVQADEFLKAAVALRSVNPQASREMMQKFVEINQSIKEKEAETARLKAQETRSQESHEANLGGSVEGLSVKMDRIELAMESAKTPEAKAKLKAQYDAAAAERARLLEKDPNWKEVELADGIYAYDQRDPTKKIRIGDAYRAPEKGSDTAAEEAAAAGADAFTPLETTLTQLEEHVASTGVATGKGVGPLEGRVPGAMAGENARSFDSMSNEMAVLLKPLIRGKGEGTWTDKDQAILDRLVPQRTDDPATIKRKLANARAMIENRRRMAGTVPAKTSSGATGSWSDEDILNEYGQTKK